MHFVDTHAHLFDESVFTPLESVLQRAAHSGVRQIINVATTAKTSQQVIESAKAFAGLYATAGIHPNYANDASDADFEVVRSLVTQKKVVALGETGLDRYWDDCPWEVQLANFERHIHLAIESGLPLIIHTRDCYSEMIEILRGFVSQHRFSAVMHSFAGTTQEASLLLELGMYISFAGMLTFKKSDDLRQTAKIVPLDRVLVETDSPYLSPEPFRGKRPNEPARVVHTASVLADILKVNVSEIAEQTTQNARSLFKKMDDELIAC